MKRPQTDQRSWYTVWGGNIQYRLIVSQKYNSPPSHQRCIPAPRMLSCSHPASGPSHHAHCQTPLSSVCSTQAVPLMAASELRRIFWRADVSRIYWQQKGISGSHRYSAVNYWGKSMLLAEQHICRWNKLFNNLKLHFVLKRRSLRLAKCIILLTKMVHALQITWHLYSHSC